MTSKEGIPEKLQAFEYRDGVDEQKNWRNIAWYHLVAGTCLPSKLQDVHRFLRAIRTLEMVKLWNIGSQRANTRSNIDVGTSFDKLVETAEQQEKMNSKHYKTTKIEH